MFDVLRKELVEGNIDKNKIAMFATQCYCIVIAVILNLSNRINVPIVVQILVVQMCFN